MDMVDKIVLEQINGGHIIHKYLAAFLMLCKDQIDQNNNYRILKYYNILSKHQVKVFRH